MEPVADASSSGAANNAADAVLANISLLYGEQEAAVCALLQGTDTQSGRRHKIMRVTE